TVLCEGVHNADDVADMAARLLRAAATSVSIGEHGERALLSASIGVAVAITENAVVDDVIRDADAAMYEAKQRGGACFTMFDDELRARTRARRDQATELWRALEQDELRVYYQPVLGLNDDGVTGVEALVRWQHPDRGLVEPGQFIPGAEESG